MKKNIRLFAIVTLIGIILSGCLHSRVLANSPFIETKGLSITQFFDDIDEIDAALAERQKTAHEMAECARELGRDDVVAIAKEEWKSAQNERKLNTEAISSWLKTYETYPYATYIWLYFTRHAGYSDIVTAGILGNIMAEVGGGTFDIKYWVYGYDDPNYYGMCQWHNQWYPEVKDTDLIFQCDFLLSTIVEPMNTCIDGYSYEMFLNSATPEEAALAFAQGYEKCSHATYGWRQEYARIAYDYFSNIGG